MSRTSPFCGSISKNCSGLLHILYYPHTKGTSCFTLSTLDAVFGMCRKHPIMLSHSFRHCFLCQTQIHEFGNTGHIYSNCTWRAVSAVHAVAFPADFFHFCKRRGIIPFFSRGFFVGSGRFQFLQVSGTSQNAADTGTGQCVMDTLVDG